MFNIENEMIICYKLQNINVYICILYILYIIYIYIYIIKYRTNYSKYMLIDIY
jgi:hypothetical protein